MYVVTYEKTNIVVVYSTSHGLTNFQFLSQISHHRISASIK